MNKKNGKSGRGRSAPRREEKLPWSPRDAGGRQGRPVRKEGDEIERKGPPPKGRRATREEASERARRTPREEAPRDVRSRHGVRDEPPRNERPPRASQSRDSSAASHDARDESSAKPSRDVEKRLPEGWVFGRHAVEAVLLHQPMRAKKMWLQEGSKKVDGLLEAAKEAGVHVEQVPRARIDSKVPRDQVHQGVLLEAKPFPYVEIDALIKQKPTLLVALDGVEDPRNLGAAARAALVMGADGLILPSRRSAKVTASAEKTAAGCLARIPVALVDNLNRSLKGCTDAGLWITGGDGAGTERPWDVDFKTPTVLIIGGEDSGLSRLVQDHCDHVVSIPMSAADVSLNAADALVALLYEVRRQRS
ncbi:MAG: 23S rRNA (guanosine(2251)-2'-O)-methyltransferase RlmB [Deltaproteobacteria bacterium]|nr:23S rRNA (guanosine(2251)-2'-O)-methyltransferase RlmB [Deltaproteobacteria bacterium]